MTLAAFQRRPLFDDVDGTIRRLTVDLKWCDDQGVNVAVFPECYLQGYALDRSSIARRALSLDGELFYSVLKSLATFKVTLIVGVIEKRHEDFYNSAAVICQGNLLGKYSKSHLNEREFSAGTEFPIFSVNDWLFGINICNDANFSESALRLSRQKARLLCFPLNNLLPPDTAYQWRKRSLENLRQRALETGCWIVSSDVVGEHNGEMSYGCTCIVNPGGEVVERVSEGIEGVALWNLNC